MKKIFYILGFLMLSFTFSFGQDDGGDEISNGKLKERFQEFMQDRLNLTKEEAAKTFPLFLRYLHELNIANKEFANDALKKRQRIIEIKLRYREQFRENLKTRLERVEPDRVDKAALEFRVILKNEAQKRNLQLRRKGGALSKPDRSQ